MNKEQENDSKSFINKKNNNNLGDKILKIENQPIVHLNFKNLKKISKNKGLSSILTFLDSYGIMNLLQVNKSLIIYNSSILYFIFLLSILNYFNK